MPYEVILTKSAKKVYSKLTPKLKEGVDRCIAYLEINPKLNPNTERLKRYPGCYRYQLAGWRILYEVDDLIRQVRIYQIRPRGDVYKHNR